MKNRNYQVRTEPRDSHNAPAIPEISSLYFRRSVQNSDISSVASILESTGYFSEEEVAVGVSLVEERLEKGAVSGYDFLFAEASRDANDSIEESTVLSPSSGVLGYTCFGHIPGTASGFDLYWIAVANTARGMGLGSELLVRTEALIQKEGGRKVYIETSSTEQYLSTRNFYLKHSYLEVCRFLDFYDEGNDKVVYVKDLG